VNREINELRMKIDNIKEEVAHDMENLRKKNEAEIQKQMESHSSRLGQAEDRISELEDEIEIKGKIEELLNYSRPVKGICKNSLTPSKDQT
jgi:chromosome segregation ATPase